MEIGVIEIQSLGFRAGAAETVVKVLDAVDGGFRVLVDVKDVFLSLVGLPPGFVTNSVFSRKGRNMINTPCIGGDRWRIGEFLGYRVQDPSSGFGVRFQDRRRCRRRLVYCSFPKIICKTPGF